MVNELSSDKLNERIGTVFIVDDEPMVTVSLKTMLSLETKHLLHCFNSPQEALDQLMTYRPEVIISDFSMPGMDGITFLKQVKERLPQSTLILLTGYADKESAIEAINTVGIYRYCQKPWDNEELKLNIKNGLERSYLVSDLKQSIQQLTQAEAELRETNLQLEALVEARTKDLQATYQKLQSIVQNSADGIITLGDQLEMTSINPTAESWVKTALGVQALTSEHLHLNQVLSIPDVSDLKTLFDAGFEAGRSTTMIPEAMIGKTPMEISVARIPAGGYVLVLRDITQRKEIERLRDDFVSTLTHDLRTPLLAAIQTMGFYLDGSLGEINEKQHQMMEMLVQSIREMLGLVNVLLEVYKYEAGRQRLVFDRVTPANIVQGVCQELEALAKSRDQSLSFEISDAAAAQLEVIADKQEIKRVVVNLIGNAIHHTPTGGNVVVKTSITSSQQWLMQVVDNGRGIPEQDIPHLFQRFSQGTSNKRSSGSGLGLYLSRQIIDAHQGKIWVESTVGEGSTFSVALPVAGN